MGSDKEFDELFRSNLDGLEAEPSAQVWTGIESHLNNSKRKSAWLPILSAAASVVVLIGAGLLFIPHQTKTNGRHLANHTRKLDQPVKPALIVKIVTEPALMKPKNGIKVMPSQIAVNTPARHIENKTSAKSKKTGGDVMPAKDGNMPVKEPVSATSPAETAGQVKPELIAETLQIPVKAIIKETPLIEQPVLATATLPAEDQPTKVRAKRRIKSFGDLVNVVVARVDKRKDKIIEFTDTDDDESTITGINLGVLKIKKEK